MQFVFHDHEYIFVDVVRAQGFLSVGGIFRVNGDLEGGVVFGVEPNT